MAKLENIFREYAEQLGWVVDEDETMVELLKGSPAGEDFSFTVEKDDFVKNVEQFANTFDPDEHVAEWMVAKANGARGVPSARILVDDAEAIDEMLDELASALPIAQELLDNITSETPKDVADRPLFLVVGESGSGKSTLVDLFCRCYPGTFTSVHSYTDRPKRSENETGYVFLTREQFDNLGELIAYTEFDGHRYATTPERLEAADFYIIDPAGAKALAKEYKGDRLVVLLDIVTEEATRRARMKQRGDTTEEINRRIEHDRTTFAENIGNEVKNSWTYQGKPIICCDASADGPLLSAFENFSWAVSSIYAALGVSAWEDPESDESADDEPDFNQEYLPKAEDDEEFQYLMSFIRETEVFHEAFWQQLRALWTAYCFHKNIDIETAVGDEREYRIWHELLPRMGKDCPEMSLSDFSSFMWALMV